MKKLSYKILYIAWAAMFVLTAALGFAFPGDRSLPVKVICTVLMVLFFLPPGRSWAGQRRRKTATISGCSGGWPSARWS